jgi:triphosphoribosyl-dephospho-CoA synthase
MEATAAKPGNVHRGCDFEDLSYPDFIVAATVTAPIFDRAQSEPLGRTILAAVEVTHHAVATNANLGTILLVAPLAKVPRDRPLDSGVADVLAGLSPGDARNVYAAIRLARPGGLGRVETADVYEDPPADLLSAMRLAADRDMVARQYAEGFHHVLHVAVPWIARAIDGGLSISDAIVHVHLELLSEYPDSLIARRSGAAVAKRASDMAAAVLAAGSPGDDTYDLALADFDFWLRSDGHQRNPGTTADLLAAGLFAALRDGIIKAPFRLAR